MLAINAIKNNIETTGLLLIITNIPKKIAKMANIFKVLSVNPLVTISQNKFKLYIFFIIKDKPILKSDRNNSYTK